MTVYGTRYRALVFLLPLAALILVSSACSPGAAPDTDADFAALQARGAAGMGVDQYASTHLFDDLPDGGRIEFQFNSDDPDQIAEIRKHLQEIQTAFASGDFSTPAMVHDQVVPGTPVMTARREHIEYVYRELPRGGELRLVTNDPESREAILEFMAFQRDDHRAGGLDHASMDHSGMDHAAMDHSGMDHEGMDRTARHLALGGGDAAFAADMDIIHELLTNHRAITRTVVHLPNGIRTVTESSSPAVAAFLVSHVASMERRLEEGEVFNIFSHTIPILFENYDRIQSEFAYGSAGVTVVQTSEDPEIVQALQSHAAEVTELVDEGMMAMMRGMMEAGLQGQMMGGMQGGMMMQGHGPMGMQGHGPMGGMHGQGVNPQTHTP